MPPSKIQTKGTRQSGPEFGPRNPLLLLGWAVVTINRAAQLGCLIRQIADGWLDYISSKSSSHFPRGPPPSSPLLPLPFFLPPFRGETPREKREQAAKEIASTSPVAPDRAPNSLFCRGFGAATFLEFFLFLVRGTLARSPGLGLSAFLFPPICSAQFLNGFGNRG